MNIKAIANIDNKDTFCEGEIEIHWIRESQAYITWKLLSEGNLIASKSENFHCEESINNMDTLMTRVIKKIESYRIGRKKIFKEVELCR